MPTTTATHRYAAMYDAAAEQHERLFGPPSADIWTGQAAAQFRFDPLREPDANLSAIAAWLQPDDVLVDVGGGAGRLTLPLARCCREAVNVEPSAGMAAEFHALAAESGIGNARLVAADWLEPHGVTGDVTLACDVTYFIRNIAEFIAKFQAAARRRALLTVWSEPPPNRGAPLFRRLYGEELAPRPGYRELLPALWEMGILPEVRLLPEPSWWESWHYPTRQDALESALFGRWATGPDRERARQIFDAQFDELFAPDGAGYRITWRTPMRELLITWETGTGGPG